MVLSLSCPSNRRIFILRMLYGSKPSNSGCSPSPSCGPCCQPGPSDCFSSYSILQFGVVYRNHNCWNSTSCSGQAQQGLLTCPGYPSLSTFAVADYSCLASEDITAFHRETTITAPAVAVHYDSADDPTYPIVRGDNQTWHCQVDTADCVQRQADVILVKENGMTTTSGCSSVGWSGRPFLPCVPHFQYTSFSTSTPFRVSIRVEARHRLRSGWAVVRAQDGSNLTVTCGEMDNILTTASSGSVTPTSHPPSPSSPTSNQESSSSLTTLGLTMPTSPTMVTSAASSAVTSLSTPGGNSQPDSTSPVLKNTGKKSSNVGAVVGGVVALVVVLVAAVLLGVFCYRRRRQQSAGASSKLTTVQRTSGLPDPAAGSEQDVAIVLNTAADTSDGNYARIGEKPKPQNGHATASGVHGNGRRPSQDPDYDVLGKKKTQTSKPAATYGRLGQVGGGGEDTEYSYDHLARGHKPPHDVIDSDYDTAGLHMTSEGDYNVVDFHKGKQQVITGSVYDVASVMTSDNTENGDAKAAPSIGIGGSGANYDLAKPIMTSSGSPDYDLARPVTDPEEKTEYSRVWE